MKSRRRFLTDILCLAGGLAAASQIQPLFAHFLEGQPSTPTPNPAPPGPQPPPSSLPEEPGVSVTEAYPSDSDLHKVGPKPVHSHDVVAVTKAYPSDSDLHRPEVTQAYPSDSDAHKPPLERAPLKKPSSSLTPLWKRLS